MSRQFERVQVIDSHTGGEPTRVVIAGGPDLGRGSLAERRARFRDHFDEAYPEALTLFDRLLRYATSRDFAPRVEVGTDLLRPLLAPQ